MQDKKVTGELLTYYAELSAHHRVMMTGFGTVYFAINQVLIMTPTETFNTISKRFPLAIVISGGLLTLFVLAATLHHACHFCSSAAMKAVMATETHYQHLPRNRSQLDTFQKWTYKTSRKVRTFVAVPTASAYVVCAIFAALAATNSYIFIAIGKSLIAESHRDTAYLFGAFILVLAAIAFYYVLVFWRHLKYLQFAKKELTLILKATTQEDFNKAIEQEAALPSTDISSRYQLEQRD